MKKRHTSAILAGFVVLTLAFFSTSCSQAEEAEIAEQPAETLSQPVEEEPIFTRDDPGAWEGKEQGHLPQIAFEKTATGLNVTVTVNHVMDNEIPHFIMWIKLFDGDGNLLGQEEFQATTENAVAVFELTSTPAKLVAHEKCNVHGIWMEEVPVS